MCFVNCYLLLRLAEPLFEGGGGLLQGLDIAVVHKLEHIIQVLAREQFYIFRPLVLKCLEGESLLSLPRINVHAHDVG